MAVYFGVIVLIFLGHLFSVYLFAMLAEVLIWQRVFDNPIAGKLTSAVTGWLVTAVAGSYVLGGGLSTFGDWLARLAIPAIIVATFGAVRGWRLRKKAAFDARIFE